MLHVLGGVAIGAVLAKTSTGKLRPFFRTVVKTGLIANRKAQDLGRSLRREAEELVAEAKAELENESQGERR
jgi:hypothetical protein